MEERISTIYSIRQKSTGKEYIGQTLHIRRRTLEHLGGKHRYTSYIDASIVKYGSDDFEVECIIEVPYSEASVFEKKYIKERNTLFPNGFNLVDGGTRHIPVVREKTKIKMMNSNRWKQYGYIQKVCTTPFQEWELIEMERRKMAHKNAMVKEGLKKRGKPIGETPIINLTTGETYHSIKFARETGAVSNQVFECLKGRKDTYRGCRWAYL